MGFFKGISRVTRAVLDALDPVAGDSSWDVDHPSEPAPPVPLYQPAAPAVAVAESAAVSDTGWDPLPGAPGVVIRGRPGETAVEMWERRYWEVFRVVESIEEQRNGWVEMYRLQSFEHMNAQITLEQALMRTRAVADRTVHMLNALREEHDIKPLVVTGPMSLDDYDGAPVGLAEAYGKRMKLLHDTMPALIDGLRVRAAIIPDSEKPDADVPFDPDS